MKNSIHSKLWKVPSRRWTVKRKFVGHWLVTELQGFDSGYADLRGPAKVKISTRRTGRMSFGAVEVELNCKMDDRDEQVLRFSFEGTDEGGPICGRGYCLVDGEQMFGRIFRHYGDGFGFRARKSPKGRKPCDE